MLQPGFMLRVLTEAALLASKQDVLASSPATLKRSSKWRRTVLQNPVMNLVFGLEAADAMPTSPERWERDRYARKQGARWFARTKNFMS